MLLASSHLVTQITLLNLIGVVCVASKAGESLTLRLEPQHCKVHGHKTDFLAIFSGGCHAKQCSDIGIMALASGARNSTSREVGGGLYAFFAG